MRLITLCVAGVLLACDAFALTLLPVDLSDVVRGSQLIVHARVLDVRSQMTAGRRSIESIVTIGVIDRMKGESADIVSFRVPVGQVGRYRRVMPGVPEFAPGEEVVVFLEGHAPALLVPFGLSQGVYRVVRRDGVALVTPPIVDSTGAAQTIARGDPTLRPVAIGVFEQRVRAVMERAQ